MGRALELARRGEARAHPNPMVGAVLVKGGRVVGEGFHTYEGVKHAEVKALELAKRAGRGATLFVNLEPCAHAGRTGPCVEAVVKAGVKRVVVAMEDPNPKVSGRGIKYLRRHGVKVDVGVLREEAERLNEAFAKWIRTRRPLVTMKTALTLDGRIAAPSRLKSGRRGRKRSATWITSEESRAEVQRMRHAADAVVTGVGTVISDDPLLTDRTGKRRRRALVRVVVDSRLRMPLRSKMMRGTQGDVMVYTTQREDSMRARALKKAGVEVVRVKARGVRVDLRTVMRDLGRRTILSVMVEAGAELGGAVLREGVVDKMVLFYAPRVMGADGAPMAAVEHVAVAGMRGLKGLTVRRVGPDFCVEGYLRNVYGNR